MRVYWEFNCLGDFVKYQISHTCNAFVTCCVSTHMIRDDCVLCDKNSHTMKKTNIVTFAKQQQLQPTSHLNASRHDIVKSRKHIAHLSPFHFTHTHTILIFYSGADIDIYDESNRIEPKESRSSITARANDVRAQSGRSKAPVEARP